MGINEAIDKAEQDTIEVLSQAIEKGASDIHFAPYEKDEIRISYRVNGVVKTAFKIGRFAYDQIAIYLKQRAGLGVGKMPESRQIKIPINGAEYSFRMEYTFSTLHDTSIITLRYTPGKSNLLDINRLGFDEHDVVLLKTILKKEMGMLLVSGPTGTGKTTTLYAALNYLQTERNANIITVEQPVDIPLRGVTQLEPNRDVSLEDLLKSAMRHDPDVLMLGEIRDQHSAKETLKASQTGHLVLTTVHANSALNAITKMINYNLDTYSFVTSTRAVLSQRLLGKLCPNCRVAAKPDKAELYILKSHFDSLPKKFYAAGKGCDKCNGYGYDGRLVAYEMFPIEVIDQDLILDTLKDKKNLDTLRKHFSDKYKTKPLPERILSHLEMGDVAMMEAIKQL